MVISTSFLKNENEHDVAVAVESPRNASSPNFLIHFILPFFFFFHIPTKMLTSLPTSMLLNLGVVEFLVWRLPVFWAPLLPSPIGGKFIFLQFVHLSWSNFSRSISSVLFFFFFSNELMHLRRAICDGSGNVIRQI